MDLFFRISFDALPPAADAHKRFVYVIGEVGVDAPVKVGRARHPLWRLHDLQSGNHRKLELRAAWQVERFLAHHIERRLQHHLSDRVLLGEWFDATTQSVIALVDRIGAANV